MTFARFVSETNSEMRRVNWPTREVCINHTIVVLATLMVLTILIAGLDYASREGVHQLLRLGS